MVANVSRVSRVCDTGHSDRDSETGADSLVMDILVFHSDEPGVGLPSRGSG